MKYLKLEDLQIPPRQRVEHTPGHIKELKASILSKGLMHPIVVSEGEDAKLSLVAGFGRFTAISELRSQQLRFNCDGQPVPDGTIPYVTVGDLSPADIAEAELEENLIRAQLTWQESAQARILIFKLRESQGVQSGTGAPSPTEVGRDLATISGKTAVAERDQLLRSLAIEKHMNNPRVRAAKSLNEGYRAVLDMNRAVLTRDLVSRGMVKTEHEVRLGDCRELLKTLPPGSIDTILTDPPYGIKADDMKKTEKHFYDDSPAHSLEVCKTIIREGFRVLKPRGNVILFCDFEHFRELRDYAKQQAFSAWRTPLIWRKGDDGHSPWGRLGFVRTYEIALYLTKGEKGLNGGGPDIKDVKRPARNERSHAAEKPIELFSLLLSLCGDQGDVVLDPCCGSAPIIPAASERKMKAICFEMDPDYHAIACGRLTTGLEEQVIDDNATGLNELLA